MLQDLRLSGGDLMKEYFRGLRGGERIELYTLTKVQAPVVQTMDSAIRRMNRYPMDKS